MLQKTTLSFLEQLALNNHKEWFEANKETYKKALENFESLVAQLWEEVANLQPGWPAGSAKKSIFRIYRDVRFSKDKTPYKAHFGAAFGPMGSKGGGGGYYLHVEPGGKSFVASGVWMPEPNILQRIRQEIDYNQKEFQALLTTKDFEKNFKTLDTSEQLKKIPKGYEENHPAAFYLRLKSFTASAPLTDAVFTQTSCKKKITELFTIVTPLLNFLQRAKD